ncbi:putative replicative DNA helicase [Vibrio phage River4]|uniref:Putative replicative DNA helicase n=1 Tax=Vibrio phage River4 TaxID=2736288 RepID=A0A6M9Z0U9_9CAUD|nr:putative replicative DNA helicase [Vibrio phage River4]QKN84717.1 putative replicative DNA helicase [Vibrio phage River4]
MINVQAVVLKLLLSCTDKELALACFDKIKPHFFSSSYGTIHKAIAKYYQDHGKVPSMDELSIKFSRNNNIQMSLSALQHLDDLDIDFDMAIEALRNEYAQQETLTLISRSILDDITMLTAEDLIDRLNSLPLKLEEKVENSGTILTASQIPVFQHSNDKEMEMIYTGISNKWDSEFGGAARQEFILLGGGTGSGKSVFCSNLQVAQWNAGNIAPYYSIEMSGREVLLRNLAIMAGVNALHTKQGCLEGDELRKLALTRAKMFHGGAEAYKNFVRNKNHLITDDFVELDQELMRNHEEIHPMIIIDDSNLRLSTIDVSLSKFRSQYGKKLTMGIVDYINETRLDTQGDPYDWVYQLELSRGFKSLARKHDCAIFSPYQLNENGQARFSKAILVPVDIAVRLDADHEAGIIQLTTDKVRSMPNCQFNIGMDWTSLKADPREVTLEEAEQNKAESQVATSVQDTSYELD